VKTFMLFLAFAVTDPEGFKLDETFHVMAKRFENKTECIEFVNTWEGTIRSRGMDAAQALIKDDYTIELLEIGCVERN
tara:strand:+ start:581 stop:814 length:234 start_codon:yes stop_codon:yes gene_type:complete